jgi:hypothetical protein
MTVTNQNHIHEEIESSLNMGNTCYHTDVNLLFFQLLSKNTEMKIHKTAAISVVMTTVGVNWLCVAVRY